jgi:hypothetical protein
VYLAAVESCAAQLRGKLLLHQQQQQQQQEQRAGAASAAATASGAPGGSSTCSTLQQQQAQAQAQAPSCLTSQVHHFLAHAPFHRMVRKALARLLLTDALGCSR